MPTNVNATPIQKSSKKSEMPKAQSKLGKLLQNTNIYKFLNSKNEEYKLEVMKKLMKLKALQHEEIRKALIDSKDLKIVKHIVTYPPGDGFWDDGEDGKGLNHMGRMWMEMRDELGGKM